MSLKEYLWRKQKLLFPLKFTKLTLKINFFLFEDQIRGQLEVKLKLIIFKVFNKQQPLSRPLQLSDLRDNENGNCLEDQSQ